MTIIEVLIIVINKDLRDEKSMNLATQRNVMSDYKFV